MKRSAVVKRLKREAQRHGVEFRIVELTNHTGVIIGGKRSTLGRHNEIDDVTARKFFDQYSDVFGKGWWR